MNIGVRTKAKEIFKRSLEVIPGGVNSPVRAFIGMEIDPLIAEKGKRDRITDVDGREFIDFCMSWGALLHGHAHPEVVQKTMERLRKGSSFGAMTEIEECLARKIVTGVKNVDQVRFVSSGTEATMTAIRLARGYTSRPLVIKFNGNYHGHSDGFLVKAGSAVSQISNQSSSLGVTKDVVKHTLSLPYNDSEAFRKVMRDPFYSPLIAAVIIEPVAANMGVVPATKAFLKVIREETRKIGALLIFDEVITGFRIAYGGGQEYFEVDADLVCFGKIVGGGFPAAAFGGRKEIMEHLAPKGKVFQAGTLSGNPVAMEGGLAVLTLASERGFYEELKRKTEIITIPVQELIKKEGIAASMQSVTGMFTLFIGPKKVGSFEDLKELDKEAFNRYFKWMWERGIYVSPSPYEACFIASVHSDSHLEMTRDALLEYLKKA